MKKPSSFDELYPQWGRRFETAKGKLQSKLLNKSNIFTPIGHDLIAFVKSSLQTVGNWARQLVRGIKVPGAPMLSRP